ncbi:MAG TPA: glycosyltransferase [Polyangia bacterium]|nr:glycosyltransferase [Polyangia bacterium]
MQLPDPALRTGPFDGARPRVSVLMRSKNSAWVIGQALAGLYSQSRRDFELVVVDSGSTDRTLEIVRGYPCRLVQIPATAYYPGAVLNQAIRESCRGDIIVFQNSDVAPLGPDALDRLLAPIERGEAEAAFARQLPRPEADTWVRRDYELAFPERGPAPPYLTYSLPLAAVTRAAWERHPFYEDAWGSEDTEWGAWAGKHGVRVAYVADALVMHSHNYTLRQLYGRRFIEGEADAFIYRKHESALSLARRWAASVWHDAGAHARARDWAGLLASPVRRAVYQWAYGRGHRLGERRIASGNRDASIGQKTVLARS